MPQRSRRCLRRALLPAVAVLTTVTTIACGLVGSTESQNAARMTEPSRWGTPSVMTTAHRSAGDAIRAFFGIRREAEQPLAFSHQLHLSKELVCTDCHEGVERGPVAGLPGLNTCMICHSQIATDRPLIKTMADLQAKGLDLTWPRVYGYPREAHVRFEHSPHVRAGVECATCHGDLRQQTIAQRSVDLSMSFCVNCHKSRQAPNDCLTCHY